MIVHISLVGKWLSLGFGALKSRWSATINMFCKYLCYLSCQHLVMHFSLSFWYWLIWLGTWSTMFLTPPRSFHCQ